MIFGFRTFLLVNSYSISSNAMARNEEKALSLLNRYLKMKEGPGRTHGITDRPARVSSCRSLKGAQKFRRYVIAEISTKVLEIQNDMLGERKIRDLNDRINELLKEKKQWERRIVELGGQDMTKQSLEVLSDSNVFIGRGYYYFGAARNLSGVREFLERKEKPKTRVETTAELKSRVDREYFGFLNPEDEEFLELGEAKSERKAILNDIDRKMADRANREPSGTNDHIDELTHMKNELEEIDLDTTAGMNRFRQLALGNGEEFAIPTVEEISQSVLELKKKLILESIEQERD